MITLSQLLAYAIPLSLLLAIYLYTQARHERLGAAKLKDSEESGLTDPPSLHPVVDLGRCVRSGACTKACPEKALGIIKGKGFLVNPTVCIGHGACAATCPVGAITLVFGTERRGVDIPYVKPTFETNVPGIYIAGELGGMGLIGKSAEQGRQAVDSIARSKQRNMPLDLIIVGAGPGGIAATLAAMQHKLRSITIEQEESLGGTVYHYPRHKVAMTHPVDLPIVGKVELGEVRKESLLKFWQEIVDQSEIEIQFGERLETIDSRAGGFGVKTGKSEYEAANVLLAIGRRGTPRKLNVPGEELGKVVYRLIDPEQYRGQNVLVVGGGDSAIEAALTIADEAESNVTISYRGDAFSRAKVKNRNAIADAERSGRIRVLLKSNPQSIKEHCVKIEHDGKSFSIDNDAVIICAGGILPMGMLRDIGILVETKYGTA